MHLHQPVAQVWRLSAMMPCRFGRWCFAPMQAGRTAEDQIVRLAQLGPDETPFRAVAEERDRFFRF